MPSAPNKPIFPASAAWFNTVFVTTPCPVSESIQSLAPAPDMSVPPPVADVTVIALVEVVLPDVIINLLVDHTTVSLPLVTALMAVWILAATSFMLATPVKFIPVMFLRVPSIVILKEPSKTANQLL